MGPGSKTLFPAIVVNGGGPGSRTLLLGAVRLSCAPGEMLKVTDLITLLLLVCCGIGTAGEGGIWFWLELCVLVAGGGDVCDDLAGGTCEIGGCDRGGPLCFLLVRLVVLELVALLLFSRYLMS